MMRFASLRDKLRDMSLCQELGSWRHWHIYNLISHNDCCTYFIMDGGNREHFYFDSHILDFGSCMVSILGHVFWVMYGSFSG